MRKIYEIDDAGLYTGSSREISNEEGRPVNFVSLTPPEGDGPWYWRDNAWTDIPPPTSKVPVEVTMAQARAALIVNGLFKRAEEALQSLPGIEGELALNDWEYRAHIRRDHALVAALGEVLGLDEEAKDDLFRQAALL